MGDKAVSEQTLAAAAMEQLPPGAVVVADRNFGVFSVAWEAASETTGGSGAPHQGASLQAIRRPYRKKGDSPVIWKSSRWDQPQTRPWPAGASLSGRFIAVRVGRGSPSSGCDLFTTLSDLSDATDRGIVRPALDIETDLRSLKRTVHLQQISSRSSEGMEKELLTAICAYNLVRAVMCLAGRRAGIAARQLSFTQVLDVVNCAWPQLIAAETREKHDEQFERVLDYAAACKLPRRRKRRSFPRGVLGPRLSLSRKEN